MKSSDLPLIAARKLKTQDERLAACKSPDNDSVKRLLSSISELRKKIYLLRTFERQRLMEDINQADALAISMLKKKHDTIDGVIGKID